MRGFLISAAIAVGALTGALATPAAAVDYPYCLQGRQTGYPGDCSYTSYAQCEASASGRAAGCGVNPRVAFAQQRGPRNGSNRGYRQQPYNNGFGSNGYDDRRY